MNLLMKGFDSMHSRFTRQISSGQERNGATLRLSTIVLLVLCAAVSFASSQTSIQSKDGYVRREGSDWVLGSSVAEKRIRLKDGQLVLASLVNKSSGHEYQDSPSAPSEFRFVINGRDVTAPDWKWSLLNEKAFVGKQGEIQLDIELASAGHKGNQALCGLSGNADPSRVADDRKWCERNRSKSRN